MAKKLANNEIGKADIIEYLEIQSDFSFELKVLKALTEKGFLCEHGGSYTDKNSNKIREFDIRATKIIKDKFFIRLAVECKQLRHNFPLLISCVPRREEEAFHEIVYSINTEKYSFESNSEYFSPTLRDQSKSIRLSDQNSIYKVHEPVGKSCAQVGKSMDGEIQSNDYEVYEKWAQALSSANDLTELACNDGSERTKDKALSIVFPILVVPNHRLWSVEYDINGKLKNTPSTINRCSFYVNRPFFHDFVPYTDEVTISHLEFVTFQGLLEFVENICSSENSVDVIFQNDNITHRNPVHKL